MDKIRVGIADDNELSREMLRVITELDDSLEIVGEAENGIEAWALVKEEKPDILLLDVVMPRGDGLEVLAKAREEGNIDTKFIMVSAVGDERTAADAMARGADYYIVKPFRAETIIREIKRSAEQKKSAKTANVVPCVYSNPQTEEKAGIRHEITRLLLAVGVPAQLNGYQYLREAILMTVQDVEYISSVTKKLYPMLAEQFNATPGSVERSIRHAIETSWSRGSVEKIDDIFGYTVDDCKGKPTNSEFIAMLADHVRMGYCKQI